VKLFWFILAAFWLGSILFWWLTSRALRSSDASRIRSRLLGGGNAKSKKSDPRPRALLPTEEKAKGKIVLRLLDRFRLNVQLRQLLEQAGLKWHIARFAHGCLALFLTGFILVWYVGPAGYLSLALGIGLLAGLIPLAYLLRKRKVRLRKFEQQFPESLEFVARSMRAGHAFSVSLEMLHREFQEPLSGEFRRTFDEHNLGLPLDAALEKLAARVPLTDVHFFVSAVLLQKRTGGNLAELLDKLAYLIRERFKLRGRIRAVSAHGRMTGTALSIIPIAVAVMMFFVNREYVTFFFTDSTGRMMIGAAAALQVIGYGVIRKIVSIEV
jgi:tight adherence protein B